MDVVKKHTAEGIILVTGNVQGCGRTPPPNFSFLTLKIDLEIPAL